MLPLLSRIGRIYIHIHDCCAHPPFARSPRTLHNSQLIQELQRQTNAFPIFIIDLFSKKYGLEKLVESTVWDLIYSCDCLRTNNELCPDIEVFCRFVTMFYDSDELLYYCYVRSLTQSVLNANFKTHWADPGQSMNGQTVGMDRKPADLWLRKRDCVHIARTIFIRNENGEIEQEKKMFHDFMNEVEKHAAPPKNTEEQLYDEHEFDKVRKVNYEIDSSNFMTIAVRAYFSTRPQDSEGKDAQQAATNESNAVIGGATTSGEVLSLKHPLLQAFFSGESVETAEANYIEEIMSGDGFKDVSEEVKDEVRDDLSKELSQRIIVAEQEGANSQTEEEFREKISSAISDFDSTVTITIQHVKSMKENGQIK